ncbi:MAG: PAS domain S-box protein [bacterium]
MSSKKPTYEELERQVAVLREKLKQAGIQVDSDNISETIQIDAKQVLTERERAEEELKESEHKYRTLFSHASEGIFIMSMDGKTCFYNEAFARMHGYSSLEDMEGIRLSDLDTPETAKLAPERLRRIIAGESMNFEVEHYHKNGHSFQLSVACNKVEIEGVSFLLGFHREITELKQAEKALRESEERLRLIYRNIDEGVILYDKELRYIFWNPYMEKLTGLSMSEAVGKQALDMFPHLREHGADVLLKRALEGETVVAPNMVYKTPFSGEVRRTTARYQPYRNVEGEITGVLGIVCDTTDLWLVEQQLLESKEKYQGIFDESVATIYVFDNKKNFIDANQAGLDLLGYTKDELMSMNITDVDADPAAEPPAHEQPLSGLVNYERCLKKKNGETITVLNNSRSITDENGKVIGLLSTLIDITERKRAERMLEDIIDKNPMSIQIVDNDGFTLKVNSAHTRLFGSVPPSDWSIFNDFQLKQQGFGELLQRVKNGEAVGFPDAHYNAHDFCPDVPDVSIWIRGIIFPLTDGGESPTRFVLMHEDITERKKTEEDLRASEERYRRLSENLPDILMRWIPDYGLDYVNPAIEKIVGIKQEDIIGNWGLFMSIVHPEDVPIIGKAFQEMGKEKKDTLNIEYRVIATTGEIVWLDVLWKPIWNDNGELLAIESIARDITERKNSEIEKRNLQQQLVHSQKMEAIGTLAGGIAHDFNNILAVIIGSVDLVVKDLPEKCQGLKHIDRINKVAKRAKDLTMNLLTFSRKEKLEVRSISANKLLQELVDLLKRSISKKIIIRAKYEVSAPIISVDMNQMLQSLLNVCINSADVMADGGTLTIECGHAYLDGNEKGKPVGIAPGNYCQIVIGDTGPGMAEEVREQIFTPFFTTKERGKGTGLGLPITLGIVQSHGGAIFVDSEPGKGTSVSIYLPVSEETEIKQTARANKEKINDVKGTLLIVDDDLDFLEMMTETLQDKGLRIIPAIGPSMALERYREHEKEIDLVILDMMMPEMGGEEVFRLLRKINPEVKVIVCSGYSSDGKAGQILAEGAIGFLQKPFDSEKLMRVITRFL